MPLKKIILAFAGWGIYCGIVFSVFAQEFPSKSIRLIVPFPAGGGADIIARLYAQKLTELWSQQVIVDNRAGAAGNIGTELAAKAPGDGHTWYLGTMGTLTVNPYLYKKLAFDVKKDFAPLTHLVNVHFVFLAHPSLPVRSVSELVSFAKAHPDQITFSSSGAGGAPHLAGELFIRLAGVKLLHIPYKGSGPSFADLLGGHVSTTFDSIVQALPYIQSHKLRALAVLGASRSALLPQMPTMMEAGIPKYDLTNWFALTVPSTVTKEVIGYSYSSLKKIAQNIELKNKLIGMGAEPVISTPEEFSLFLQSESIKWGKIVQSSAIKAE